jgi:hypothetical protein
MTELTVNVFHGISPQIPTQYKVTATSYQDAISQMIRKGLLSGQIYGLQGEILTYDQPITINEINYIVFTNPDNTDHQVRLIDRSINKFVVYPFDATTQLQDLYNYLLANDFQPMSSINLQGDKTTLITGLNLPPPGPDGIVEIVVVSPIDWTVLDDDSDEDEIPELPRANPTRVALIDEDENFHTPQFEQQLRNLFTIMNPVEDGAKTAAPIIEQPVRNLVTIRHPVHEEIRVEIEYGVTTAAQIIQQADIDQYGFRLARASDYQIQVHNPDDLITPLEGNQTFYLIPDFGTLFIGYAASLTD